MTETSVSREFAQAEPVIQPAPAVSASPDAPAAPAAPSAAATRRRPARKPSKPDAVLAAAVDTARGGVLQVAPEAQVGSHLGVVPEAERLVTHRFAANVPGYAGWQWFATLARVPRGKDATICEVGLLPSEDSLLAPDWVPWAERVRPEDTEQDQAAPVADESDNDDAPAEDPGAVSVDAESAAPQSGEDAGTRAAGGEPPLA